MASIVVTAPIQPALDLVRVSYHWKRSLFGIFDWGFVLEMKMLKSKGDSIKVLPKK